MRMGGLKHPNLLFLSVEDVNSFQICLFDMQEVVRVQGEHERLLHIQRVVKELPTPHFR